MNPVDWQRIKDIFAEAQARSAETRNEFVKNACRDNDELYAEVISLLAASDEPENLIENNAIDLAGKIVAEEKSVADQHFGNFRIIREIGSGGMGTVFLAERDDGEFVMQVALKIVRQSVADREIIERFRRERQILADLRHPNIAVLHDGGLSEKGEPFLAMEYIDGETLIDYANSHGLSVDDRLRLLIKVCAAVAFAHRNLIVHRDIKPSNILVGADGEPKLLDFGLAKSFDSKDSDIQTTLRAFTPAYASPEQITGGNITTASDIYSLGVILYELLTGAKPLQFDDKSFEEIIQTVVSTDPRPPSESGGAELTGESRKLRGDLDNIALMALRKEPERRYRSVEDFADDLQNHLDDRPVIARPNTFGYRTAKFVARNKIAVAAAILVTVSLLAGLGTSLWQAEIAKRQSARSEAVNQFLRKMLMTAMPENRALSKRGQQASILDVLADVEKRIDAELSSEPEVRAQLRQLVGDVYLSQGRYDDAERNLTQAFKEQQAIFGMDGLETIKSEMSLASLYFVKADYDRATEIYERRFDSFRQEFHAGRIEASFYLGKLTDFATMCRARGESGKAEVLLNENISEAAKYARDDLAEGAQVILSLILLDQGRFAEAKSNQSSLVSRLRTTIAADDPGMASSLTLLGSIQMENGELENAAANLTEAEGVYKKNYGPEYMATYDNIRLQSQVAFLRGDAVTAERLIDAVLVNYRKNAGPKYISFATALTVKGRILLKLGKIDEAEKCLREAVSLRRENLPPGHFLTGLTLAAMGECLLARRVFDEAETILTESFEILQKTQGADNPRTAMVRKLREELNRARTEKRV